MKRTIFVLLCLGLVFAVLSGTAMAATEAEKRAAIDNGLAWLATQQQANGAIGSGGQGVEYLQSQTGAALLAFLEEKDNWGANTAAYQAVVNNGLNYLLNNASVVSISPQTAGNPDSDGNGIGVKLYPGGINSRDTYVTGIALPAIAATKMPNALVTTGPLATRTDGSGAGGAWTYKDVVQNVIDYFAFGQSDPATGVHRGGWRYYANYGNSDQSTTQWPVIASLYGTLMGVSTPGFVKSELDYWTNYIQNPVTGAAGYQSPSGPHGEMNETGALLIEQDFLGWGTSDSRVQKALGYIDLHWKETANSTWDGNFGHPYAMWAIYKGLELMIGLNDTTYITNLHPQGTAAIDPGDTWNWWEDYCEYLVSTQGVGGNWAGYSYWNPYLATPWYINILAATKIPGGGDPVPEPATMLLLGSGLVGLAGLSRKRKKP